MTKILLALALSSYFSIANASSDPNQKIKNAIETWANAQIENNGGTFLTLKSKITAQSDDKSSIRLRWQYRPWKSDEETRDLLIKCISNLEYSSSQDSIQELDTTCQTIEE